VSEIPEAGPPVFAPAARSSLALPRTGAERPEAVERAHGVGASLAGGPRPPEVLAVGELDAGVLERPAIDFRDLQRLLEPVSL
jgi:hypothetical protein